MEPGIPVNTAILKWARLRAGHSIYGLGKSFPKYDSWEKGKSMPTAAQLDRLAGMLKVPVAVFFFPKPPKESTTAEALHANQEEILDNLNPATRLIYRKAKTYQIYLRELLNQNGHEQNHSIAWLKKVPKVTGQKAAEQVRELFGIEMTTQLKWRNADIALEKWREIFIQRGIFVFKEAFKDEKIAGFCLYDDTYPIIFLNNSHLKTRQIFTLFHQLGHLIRKESYLDQFTLGSLYSETKLPKSEVFCNAFASHFLIPDTMADKIQLLDLPEKIFKSADLYKVGADVFARRAFEIKRITSKEYKKALAEYKREYEAAKAREKRKRGGNYYSTHLSYIGKDYCGLVMNSYYQGKINSAKASEYLDIKPKSLAGIESAFIRKGSK